MGFKSGAEGKGGGAPRKKAVSTGLLVTVIILAIVIGAWLFLEWRKSTLDEEIASLQTQIDVVNDDIRTAISEEESDFAVRAYLMAKSLFRGHETNSVLKELENNMILKNSDQSGERVVLKSFQHNSGAKTERNFDAGSATLTGAGNVTVTFDADTFDVMAQQIDVFKKSEMFENVKVGSTDRDDDGRIVFTLTMSVVGNDSTPYEGGGQVETPQEQAPAVPEEEVQAAEEQVEAETSETPAIIEAEQINPPQQVGGGTTTEEPIVEGAPEQVDANPSVQE